MAYDSLDDTKARLDAEHATSASPSIDEKSQQIIDHAVEVLGGEKYLNVQTVIGKGFYTSFRDVSSNKYRHVGEAAAAGRHGG